MAECQLVMQGVFKKRIGNISQYAYITAILDPWSNLVADDYFGIDLKEKQKKNELIYIVNDHIMPCISRFGKKLKLIILFNEKT